MIYIKMKNTTWATNVMFKKKRWSKLDEVCVWIGTGAVGEDGGEPREGSAHV
jgi:hypothetical protein